MALLSNQGRQRDFGTLTCWPRWQSLRTLPRLTGVYARQLERQPVAECCGGHDDACARAFASCVEMAVAVFAVIHTGMGTMMRRLLLRTEAQTPAAFLATDCWSPGLIIPQTYGALAGGKSYPMACTWDPVPCELRCRTRSWSCVGSVEHVRCGAIHVESSVESERVSRARLGKRSEVCRPGV